MSISAISFWNSIQPKSRSSAKELIAGVGRLCKTLHSQFRIMRFWKHPELQIIASKNPRLYFKHLSSNYLFGGITAREASICLHYHYKRVRELFNESFLVRLMLQQTTIHEMEEGGHTFSITLGAPFEMDKEGETKLALFVDGKQVFILCFSIVPGWVVGSEQQDVILIGRLQGLRGDFERISLATKAFCDVCPSALLLAALAGIAKCLSIQEFAGVSASRQPCYSEALGEHFKQGYDHFFKEVGATETPNGFYRMPVPLPEKPLQMVKRGHRARTIRKRAFKRSISKLVANALYQDLRHESPGRTAWKRLFSKPGQWRLALGRVTG